jgi:hypothetical protein
MPGSSGLLCYKGHSSRLQCCKIMFRPIPNLYHTRRLCWTKKKNNLKQQAYKFGWLHVPCQWDWLQTFPLKLWLGTEAAAKFFNNAIQCAGWSALPEKIRALNAYDCPVLIKQKTEEKRRLHRERHRPWTPTNKSLLNAATQELKELFHNTKRTVFKHSCKDLQLQNSVIINLESDKKKK